MMTGQTTSADILEGTSAHQSLTQVLVSSKSFISYWNPDEAILGGSLIKPNSSVMVG